MSKSIRAYVQDDAAAWVFVTIGYNELERNDSWDKIEKIVEIKLANAKETIMEVLRTNWTIK